MIGRESRELVWPERRKGGMLHLRTAGTEVWNDDRQDISMSRRSPFLARLDYGSIPEVRSVADRLSEFGVQLFRCKSANPKS